MTKWDRKRKKPNWNDILKWEDDNEALVMWVCTPNCIRERAENQHKSLGEVTNKQIYEFIYQTRRGWNTEDFKNVFKDFVIDRLRDYYG